MKKYIFTSVLLLSVILGPQNAVAGPLLHLLGHKKANEIKFVLETFGPATVKCYYKVTRGADLTIDRFEKALKSGYISQCLQQTAAEQAEYLSLIHI